MMMAIQHIYGRHRYQAARIASMVSQKNYGEALASSIWVFNITAANDLSQHTNRQ
tara:strand:+ start:977 stop:1141 length:165 start_codon:yes stop_codon:yes gene_type:complete